MDSTSRFRGITRLVVLTALAGVAALWMFERPGNIPEDDEEAASSLSLVVAPQDVVVERSEKGGPSQVTFTLTNVGKQSLRVESVETSCGCSVAQPMTDQTIRPGSTQTLVIAASPPKFDSRNVHVRLNLLDPANSSRKEIIPLQMKLMGKPLPPTRIYNFPQVIELSGTSPGELVRLFQFNTVEQDEKSPWITGLSSKSEFIKAEILSCDSTPRTAKGAHRTYQCRLTATLPQNADEILAGAVHLTTGASDGPDLPVIHVAWAAYPSVLKAPARQTAETITQSVTVQAIGVDDAESLQRLELSHAPAGVRIEWLPVEEPRLRKLLVRIPASDRVNVPPTESITLLDPQTHAALVIRLVQDTRTGASG